MSFQSDMLGIPIERPACVETTALGAAYLCGLALGVYQSTADVKVKRKTEHTFEPTANDEWRNGKIKEWRRAVERTLGWKE
jgi:glycerol kinase